MNRKLVVIILLAVVTGFGVYSFVNNKAESHASGPAISDLISGKPQVTPIPGMVTMVDLGAHSCVPCKMMAPIIKELSAEYEGKAAIVFIDVWQNPDEGKKYAISAIPTQIFYDADGVERYRHQGFFDKAAIKAKLAELGVK
ncbi:thioredoxin family protein [Maridesulfovibrio frigidus]|uniref:thioredoxin family protein n=1 Tax=Maridesulfovibrio frigidus TaxID=340956 RepID=UPI0004E20C74|nr:thioredoxin family protein [Maridesulfovibrio frigidus]